MCLLEVAFGHEEHVASHVVHARKGDMLGRVTGSCRSTVPPGTHCWGDWLCVRLCRGAFLFRRSTAVWNSDLLIDGAYSKFQDQACIHNSAAPYCYSTTYLAWLRGSSCGVTPQLTYFGNLENNKSQELDPKECARVLAPATCAMPSKSHRTLTGDWKMLHTTAHV